MKVLLIDSNVCWNEDKSFRHTRCFIRDITEENIIQAVRKTELLHAKLYTEAKSNFLQLVVHNLRTPLHSLIYEMESIKELENGPTGLSHKEVVDKVSLLEEPIQILLDMVEDVAFASQFDRGKVPVITGRKVNFMLLVRSIVDSVVNRNMRSGQEVTIKIERTPSYLRHVSNHAAMLPSTCARVLHHLLGNAVQYRLTGSEVLVTLDYKTVKRSNILTDCVVLPSRLFADKIDDIDESIIRNTPQVVVSISNTSNAFVDTEVLLNYTKNFYSSYTASSGDLDSFSEGLGIGLYVSSHLLECMGSTMEFSVNGREVTFAFALSVDVQESLLDEDPNIENSSPGESVRFLSNATSESESLKVVTKRDEFWDDNASKSWVDIEVSIAKKME